MRRFIGGVVGMVGKMEITHKPKRQTSTQTSTCGTKLSTGRVVIELCHDIRHMRRILDVELNVPTKFYGDNKSMHE